jgi:hypothetical protein
MVLELQQPLVSSPRPAHPFPVLEHFYHIMRIALFAALLASTISNGSAFAFSGGRWGRGRSNGVRMSTVEAGVTEVAAAVARNEAPVVKTMNLEPDEIPEPTPTAVSLISAEVKSRLDSQLAKLREKDTTSLRLTKEVSGRRQSPIIGENSRLQKA